MANNITPRAPRTGAFSNLTPRVSTTTVSDITRKRQIGDLITHIAKSDNHLFQALNSLQDQVNQIIENVMDTGAATTTVATNTGTALPSVPGGGGSTGGSGGASTGGSGGTTVPPMPSPNPPPGTGSAPPPTANFVIQNQTVTGTVPPFTYAADFSWSNPSAPGSTIFFGGIQLWVTKVSPADTNFVPPFMIGSAAYNGTLGSSQSTHVTVSNGPTVTEAWTVTNISINTVGQPLEQPNSSTFNFSQQVTWNMVP